MNAHVKSRHLVARSGAPISIDQLRHSIPSLFQDAAHESRSDRFVPIPSHTLLAALDRSGFSVVAAHQCGTRTPGKEAFTKHQLRLRHPDAMPANSRVGSLIPEIILTNGNDGTAAYSITAGLFRVVCQNGWTVGETFESVRVAHTGKAAAVLDNVIEATFSVVETAKACIDAAQELGVVQLDHDRAYALAEFGRDLRWGGAESAPVAPSTLLAPRRQEDHGRDAWTIANVVQENVLRGGQAYSLPNVRQNARAHMQHRLVRPIVNLDDDKRINRALWDQAMRIAA